jgi:hypothetical protein
VNSSPTRPPSYHSRLSSLKNPSHSPFRKGDEPFFRKCCPSLIKGD